MDASTAHLSGLRALEAGEIDAAYDFARQATRLNADDPQVIFLMAMVLAERHRFAEAIEMLEEVAETTPEARLPAMGQTADWLVRYGKWAAAEARYREILRQMPDAVVAHRNLASLLIRQGRRLEASSHLHRLCYLGDVTENELRSMLTTPHPFVGDVDNDRLDPVGPLGKARTEIARGDWKAARTRMQRIDSPGPWESALLARAHAVLGEMEALRSWVVVADTSANVSPDAWFAKGVYAVSVGQATDATRCFAEAVLLDPTDSDAYFRMAQSLSATNATPEADATRQRGELVEKTQSLGMKMSLGDDRDQQSLLMLSDLLAQLGRPFESLGWRGVWLTYADSSASVSQSDAQKILEQIYQHRTMLVEKNQTSAPAEFVLCGVDLASLPSREAVDERLKSPTHESER